MSTKKDLRAAQAELSELRRMLARIFPSGDRRSPHALWKQIRRLADHAHWLEWLSDPTPSQPTAVSETANADSEASTKTIAPGGRSAEQPLLPGVRLAPDDGRHSGDRNLYHSGYEYQAELVRLTNAIKNLVNQSADWLRGLDLDPVDIPSKRRPRCQSCSEIMATTWRYCPYCSTAR